jgi:hypothetical protein
MFADFFQTPTALGQTPFASQNPCSAQSLGALMLFLALSSATSAQDARVRLDLIDAQGRSLSSVEVGDQFWLATYVTDLRSDGQGVFANYADIVYDAGRVTPLPETLEFHELYPNGSTTRQTVFATPGLLDEVGSFGTLNPVGSDEQLQFQVALRAEAAGTVVFMPGPPDEAPMHDFLLWGANEAVPFATVDYQSATLRIVPEPEGFMPLLVAAAWVFRRRPYSARSRL